MQGRLKWGFAFSSLQSLLLRSPKRVSVDKQGGWLHRIFNHSKHSPTYLLLKELFLFLEETDLFAKEFPLLCNSPEYLENNMFLHIVLLHQRILHEHPQEAKILLFNAEIYFFSQFAQKVMPFLPIGDYDTHYVESYKNKIQVYIDFMDKLDINTASNVKEYQRALQKYLYKGRVEEDDKELTKYCKYYSAHRKYLFMLAWDDILLHRIKWGFQEDYTLIESL